MSGFLDQMAAASAERALEARRAEPLGALERRAAVMPPPLPLRRSGGRFDVIAEIKLRSPAAGSLGRVEDDWQGKALAYAQAGAAAVSVLTEPSRFDGSLRHLEAVAGLLAAPAVPAMRKDFLVDPYQVVEARAAGAGGVLVILRMVSRAQLAELLDTAVAQGLWVLLEAFDAADLDRAASLLAGRPAGGPEMLVGVNCRDLQTLEVRVERFAELAAQLPRGHVGVAESGVATAADARRMMELGYPMALIGTALMQSAAPGTLLADIFRATRTP
jgi:indole-3-glycerol phosphate synthase